MHSLQIGVVEFLFSFITQTICGVFHLYLEPLFYEKLFLIGSPNEEHVLCYNALVHIKLASFNLSNHVSIAL